MKRLVSIDFLRGIVILLMTLDHTRDMFSSVSIEDHLGTNLQAIYYITRWITHFCAPTFVFLAGLSVFLRQQRYPQNRIELQAFVIKRGLFLVLISTAVVSLFWTIILRNQVFTIYCAELWAIGGGMIFVALMLYFRPFIIFAVSVAFVLLHNSLDGFDSNQSILWSLLHVKREWELITGYINVIFFYPLIPWFGVAGLGYCAGYYFFNSSEDNENIQQQRKYILFFIVGFALLAFFILRYTNFYGDANLFVAVPNDMAKTLFSFFDVTKYPPSLLYITITLSFVLLILALDGAKFFNKPSRLVKMVTNYGECALPYYIVHLIVITLYARILALVFNHGVLINSSYLIISYLVTAGVIVSLYPFVLWFKKMRNTYKNKCPILTYF